MHFVADCYPYRINNLIALSRRCVSTAQTMVMRRTGTSCTSAYVLFLPLLRHQWPRANGTRRREDRDSQRAVLAGSSWRQPRSCQRVASPRKTRDSGPTRRSRRSSGSSTLCTCREPKLVSSSRMRGARPRHSPRGSSQAQIASIMRTPRLPLLTRVDGLITVRHTFPDPIDAHVSRLFVDVSRLQSMGR